MDYDALIVATGSAPHPLPPRIASPAALDSGRVTHLRSLADARRVSAALEHTPSPRDLIYEAGFIGAETAGILHDTGCNIILAASSAVPGVSAFGAQIAEQLAQAHQGTVATHFGHALTRLDLAGNEVHAEFIGGRDITADLVITALGARQTSPPSLGRADRRRCPSAQPQPRERLRRGRRRRPRVRWHDLAHRSLERRRGPGRSRRTQRPGFARADGFPRALSIPRSLQCADPSAPLRRCWTYRPIRDHARRLDHRPRPHPRPRSTR